jgi:hypothetical protein
MKNLLIVVFTTLLSTVLAQTSTSNSLSKEVRRAKAEQIMLKKTGGRISRPGTQKGEICYVNCQNIIPKEWIQESIEYFSKITNFKISYKAGVFHFPNPQKIGNASLFVVNDSTLPSILVSPEDCWAIVNICVIAKEKHPAFFEARVKKELSRAFAYLCGGVNSQYQNSLTRGISSHSELDKNFDYKLPMDVVLRFRSYMESFGVTPMLFVPYRKACEEGWAPAPTNEYQKAIWDKVHAMPTSPIKIKPETKKVRE